MHNTHMKWNSSMAVQISRIGNQKKSMRIREIDKIELECEDSSANQR
jgi:hypothetical protein